MSMTILSATSTIKLLRQRPIGIGDLRSSPRSVPSGRQAADEIDDRGVDLAAALLLGPVAATRQHLYLAQCRDELFEIGQMLIHAREGDDHVAVTGDIEGRHRHRHAVESRHQFPVAVYVAIIVEGAAEAAALELGGVEVKIGFAEPGWRRRR